MERKEILCRVQSVISDCLGIEMSDIKESDDVYENLGADSLDVVEINMNLEDEFALTIDDEHLETTKTVEDLVNIIEKLSSVNAEG